jgi:hypothetical protein
MRAGVQLLRPRQQRASSETDDPLQKRRARSGWVREWAALFATHTLAIMRRRIRGIE